MTSQPAAAVKAPNHFMNAEQIYDINMLYEQILKLNNPNFAGN